MDIKTQKRIQEHFERMYRADQKPWVNHGREKAIDKFSDILRQKFGKAKVLDIGCGNGWISIRLAQNGHEVWGIDSSPTAIEEAKFLANEAEVGNLVHFQVGDALNLPYKDNSFEAILDRGLFHHILPENRHIYLKNILRVLKKKSFMYLSVFSTNNPESIGQLFEKEDIEEIFGRNFKITYHSQDKDSPFAPAHLMHFILERIS